MNDDPTVLNPRLPKGEVVMDPSGLGFRIGDGRRPYNNLPLQPVLAGPPGLPGKKGAPGQKGPAPTLNATLTALAELTTTAFGRSLLTLLDAAAGRTALALGSAATHPATDFETAGAAALAQAASQPLDSDLSAIALLTTTAYGRAFLALADAAAGRAALGLGTLATQSGTFSGTSSGTNTGDQVVKGYVIMGGADANLSFADATTYYIGWLQGQGISARTSATTFAMTVPKAGTITRITWEIILATANGSNEAVTHILRLNNTTDTSLSTSETYDPGTSTLKPFNYTGLSIAVAAGDTIVLKIVCPTWATNPQGLQGTLAVYVD